MASNPNEHDFARLQSLLGHVLDASVEGIFAVDRDLKVTIFNAALERAFNVVRASVLGREILKSFPCMAAAGEEALMRGALAGTAASAKSHAFEIE
ncbi:MAG TPA: PAS domain-containing protein, partial [Elusimicrobiota bacterium]|nr:PAS domain-containing protein [Elusimicrobiota bacterium]